MKIVTALFHSYRQVKQALAALHRHHFGRISEEVTVIDQDKVSSEDATIQLASGTLDGSLIRLGVSAEKARVYAEDLKQGSKLVVVKAEGQRAMEALNLLYDAGAANSDFRTFPQQGK